MQTDGGTAGLGQNFSVAALQRQVGKSSNIGIIGVNRSSLENGDFVKSAFNRLLGVDYNFASAGYSNSPATTFLISCLAIRFGVDCSARVDLKQ